LAKKAKSGYKLELSNFKQYEEIPDDWHMETLDVVGKIVGGGTPKTTIPEYWDGDILWATPSDLTTIEGNYIDDTERKITKNGLDESPVKLIEPGNLIFSSRATIGECKINTKPVTTNQGFQNIVPKKEYENMFVFYIVQQNQIKFIRFAYGTTFLEISKNNIKKVKIAFPKNNAEQTKISLILFDIDNLLSSYREILQQNKSLKKGLMQTLFTKGIGHKKFQKVTGLFRKEMKIPVGWEIKNFNEIFEFLVTGTNPRKDLGKEGDIHYIHYGDIHTQWNRFILDCESEEIPLIVKTKVKQIPLLKEGDLIIADASEDYEGSGASILLKNVKDKKIVAGLHTFGLRIDDEIMPIDFRTYITSNRFVKRQIISFVTGVSVYGLSKNNLKKIKICLPKIKEQEKIGSILSKIDKKIIDLETKETNLKSLKKGLMQKLLTGQIRVVVR
jgi:type I restriction enzyme, S subunit